MNRSVLFYIIVPIIVAVLFFGALRIFFHITHTRSVTTDVVQGILVGAALAFITVLLILPKFYVTKVNGWATMFWMRRARQRPPLACRMQRDIYGSHKRTARGDVLDDQQRWRGSYAIRSTRLHVAFRGRTTAAKQRVLVTHYGRRGQSLCTESYQPI